MTSRGGAVEYGRIYEQKTAALFAIRCALDPLVTDFWIVSNVADFGAFDDVVLLVEKIDGSKIVYCIQLKHIENRPLQASQLEAERGDFRLVKYHDSYKSIKKNIKKIGILNDVNIDQIYFILYTNAGLVGRKSIVSITLENTDSFDFLTTKSTAGNVFQVGNSRDSKSPLDESFLQHFFLYTKQASFSGLDRLIKNEFDSHFDDISNTVIITITDYFVKWALAKKSNMLRIFKKDVQMKLLEYLLQPHVIEPKHHVVRKVNILKLLNDTLTKFNVTPIVHRNSLENIFAAIDYILRETCDVQHNFDVSWNTNLSEDQHDTLKAKDKEKKEQIHIALKERHHFVAYLTVRDLYFAAWQCNVIPLIISCDLSHNSVQKILFTFENVTKNLSFVLLYPKDLNDLKGSLKVFNNFTDINDISLFNRNLENTYISLQGKGALSLKEFEKNIEVLSEITPDLYMTLLNGVLQLGETREVENYYIKRSLQRPRLSLDVLNEPNLLKADDTSQSNEGDLFLLLEFNTSQYIPYKYRAHMVDVATYVQSMLSGTINEAKYIITITASSTDDADVIDQIVEKLHKRIGKAIHVLKVQQNCLEWLYSKGPVDILYKYVDDLTLFEENDRNYIQEDSMLQHFQSHINIISNNAGMGKTSILKSLANKFDSSKWVCFISLSEHMSKISQIKSKNPTDYIKYITDWQISLNDNLVQTFCTQIFNDRWNSGNVIWLLDGYDEVASEETFQFLREVRKILNIKIWITTRPTYNKELEMIMGALSLQITHFREEDHVSFLWKYFNTFHDIYGYSDQQIQYIIDTINKCSAALDKTFIAIPLQTRMFAEIFGDDINQITDKERLTIVDLYNKFVNIKLKEYKSYEATSLKKTLSKLALKLFFTADQLEDLLDFEELKEEALTFQESYKKDSIVIGLNEFGDAVFGHRTFAEFLAAHWLAKQIVTKKGQRNVDWAPLVEKLFYVDMISVRVFFDRILCQDLPLHLAVLNNDTDNVKHLLKEETVTLASDKLGRSALHLAVSYGKYYDLYVSSNIKGLRAVGLHTVVKESTNNCILEIPIVKTQLQIPTEIVEVLLDHGCVNNLDILFNYDAFDYAMKSCSLDNVNCLFKRMEKDTLLMEPEFNFKAFLYCVIYDNLHHILSHRKIYDFDTKLPLHHQLRNIFKSNNLSLLEIKYNDFYLTEIASYTGGKETVFELLQTGKLSVEDGFPVHRASFNGHYDVVDLLFKMGANIEKQDIVGWNPMYIAGKRGRSDITYQFLKDDAHLKSMQNKTTAMTPMHYACQGGYLDCVKKLVELGASFFEDDAYSNTPLYYASLYGHIDVLEFLLNILTPEQKEDKRVKSVLNVAASKGYKLEKLINCGLDVNNIDADGNTPLILACKNGFPQVIEDLAQSQKCNLNLMKTNENLNSVIRWAQLNNFYDFSMKLLLLPSRDKSVQGGISALHFSTLEGHTDCVQTLVDLGADTSIEDTIGLGYSPLIWASLTGRDGVIQALLTRTDSSYAQKNLEDAEIALIWASALGYESCVNILLNLIGSSDNLNCSRNQERLERILQCEYGTDYNKIVRPFGEVKNIPIVVAAINNRTSVIKLLVSQEYKCNQEDLNVALFWASKKGHLETVKTLIESGADENTKNERMLKALPIVWASMNGRTDIVNFFLSDKGKEYANNEDVLIALNFAATNGHTECLKLLLNFGLDINHAYEDLTGGTPLLNACEYYGNAEVINELLTRNCDIHAKNSNGLTALDILAKKKKFDLVKRLLSMGAPQDDKVDKESDLHKDLQEALEWAVAQEENDMIYRLAELGIQLKENPNEKPEEDPEEDPEEKTEKKPVKKFKILFCR